MKHCEYRQAILDADGKFLYWHYWGLSKCGGHFVEPRYLTNRNRVMFADRAIANSFAYTGKKDINDKKIWEGSRVNVIYCGDIDAELEEPITENVVRWDNELSAFVCADKTSTATPLGSLENYYALEVIGSTSENPELLDVHPEK